MADVTVDQFREMFPEFNPAIYTNARITGWLNVAMMLVRECAWGRSWPLGVELFTAHNLALSALAALGAEGGGVPGIARGVVASESGGTLSVSYDTTAALIPGAGHWNLTTYGQQFAYYIRIFGAGGVQVGAGSPSFAPLIGVPFGPGWGVPW